MSCVSARRSSRMRRREEGASLIESVFVLPLMAVLSLTALDIGRAVNSYLVLTRIAYEGTRFAASTPGLRADSSCGVSNQVCDSGMTRIHTRIRLIASEQGLSNQELHVETYVAPIPGVIPPSYGVEVRLRLGFQPLVTGSFIAMIGPLRTKVSGPYLLSAS